MFLKVASIDADLSPLLTHLLEGRTPICVASEMGHVEVVKFLAAEMGADINIEDNEELTPISKASMNGHRGVMTALITYAIACNEGRAGNGCRCLNCFS